MATAGWLLAEMADEDFKDVEGHWTSSLMLHGQVYVKDGGTAILCFGSSIWGFTGWPLTESTVGEDVVFFPDVSDTAQVAGASF
jgi:hypothetical protein